MPKPRTMAELQYRLKVIGSVAVIAMFVLFIAVRLIIAFWPLLFVFVALGFGIRALVRKVRQPKRH